MKVCVLGAAGGIGQPLSLLLKLQLPAGSEGRGMMGLDRAKKRAHELVDEACAALSPFGNKGGILREAALFIVERKN